MPTHFSPEELIAIPAVLSTPRFQRYLDASANNAALALAIYRWNSQVSAAFLHPLHICEVALRNAISNAIEAVYGARWPWAPGFRQSLPEIHPPRFSSKAELIKTANKHQTTGKVVADLKFAFWVDMLTARHDSRLWMPYFEREFPFGPAGMVKDDRRTLYREIDAIREFRNRIAHHEPIFGRQLDSDLRRIISAISMRCETTANWVAKTQSVSELLNRDPRQITSRTASA